ncbi:glutathione S-transferase Gst3 [Schizosaccharomyces cryophilus OY26]|uniref:Glutathione S-transferase Gst3 n=1 Tax=Schizosaccharomyces cryophilus (strain OY26 / ATCC MYA-4695 / CBS 11777 / NBRC 106824 / NRRL Y48691) TaxID=653667 RepID=S9W0Y3_SCHCR|nr:glutathione S-transferase Gst3 [Schizosaccharomyces cryophilus OY26]EPY52104.1 glutathione S-transferase Gst3 [Schizosaccharomyces cryophilus OY26]
MLRNYGNLLKRQKHSIFAKMSSGGTITNWAGQDGEFRRQVSSFRESVSKEHPVFQPEIGRYHLYVSLACPWAHRTLIVRKLKGLEEALPVHIVGWLMGPNGWDFETDHGSTGEPLYKSPFLRNLYFRADPNYNARFTVPVFWDVKHHTIVNNESSEIIRFLNYEFNDLITDQKKKEVDLYPKDLRSEIDKWNDYFYNTLNNGVYKSGFATTAEAYERNVKVVFEALDKMEDLLKQTRGPYVLGDRLTETDVRLYTTIIRFDPVYVQHFKCNIGTIRHDYPHIHTWLRNLYWRHPAFFETTDFDHIKWHYTRSHTQINPLRITPLGPLPPIEPL